MCRWSSPDKLGYLLFACTAPRCGCRFCGSAAMTDGRERRGVSQKRFAESFLTGKEGSRGKNAEQGFAAVIVFVPRERVGFLDTLESPFGRSRRAIFSLFFWLLKLNGTGIRCNLIEFITVFPKIFHHLRQNIGGCLSGGIIMKQQDQIAVQLAFCTCLHILK